MDLFLEFFMYLFRSFVICYMVMSFARGLVRSVFRYSVRYVFRSLLSCFLTFSSVLYLFIPFCFLSFVICFGRSFVHYGIIYFGLSLVH